MLLHHVCYLKREINKLPNSYYEEAYLVEKKTFDDD